MRPPGGVGPHGLAQVLRKGLSGDPFLTDTIQWGIVAAVHGTTSTMLTTSAAAGASTIYTAAAPVVNDYLTIGSTPSNAPRVISVTGSGPYTVDILPGLALAQTSGASVTALPTLDVYLNGAQNPTPASALTTGIQYLFGTEAPAVGSVIPLFRGIGGLQSDRFTIGRSSGGGSLPLWLMYGNGSPIAGNVTPTQVGAVYFDLLNGAIFEAAEALAYVGAASAGVDVSTFTGSGTLTTSGLWRFPSAGSITVDTSAGVAAVTYTGTSAYDLTGCTTVSGSGTLNSNGLITLTTLSPAQWMVIGGLDLQDFVPVGLSSPDGLGLTLNAGGNIYLSAQDQGSQIGFSTDVNVWAFQPDGGLFFPLADIPGGAGATLYCTSSTPSSGIGAAGDWCVTLDGGLYYNNAGTWMLYAGSGSTAWDGPFTVSAVHPGSPNTIDCTSGPSGVPCLVSYVPYVGDLALIAENTGYGSSPYLVAVGALTTTGGQNLPGGGGTVPAGVTGGTFILKGASGAGDQYSITAVSGNGTNVTFTASNSFLTGDTVFLFGLGGGFANLNNNVFTVLSTGLSSSQFEIANATTGTTTTGTAANLTYSGPGSTLIATLPAGTLTPGQAFYVTVGTYAGSGAGGYNARPGGGASDFRIGSNTLATRALVAAGGGAAGANCNASYGGGGAGGGLTSAANGGDGDTGSIYGGAGATSSAGGAGGAGSGGSGGNGTLGFGGDGGGGGNVGGGGGDGRYGGGGGGPSGLSYSHGGGGGGGTDLASGATGVTSVPGSNQGNGSVSVVWITSGGGAATVPGAPTGLTPTAGNAEVSLAWTAPTNAGGSAITSYQVFYGTSPTSLSLYGTLASGGNVTGLTNGTLYYFAVAAVNSFGAGPLSAQTSATPTSSPPTVPGVPTGLVANPGNTEVTLAWTAPVSDGGSAITSYTVYYGTTSSLGSSETLASGGTVTGLTNNTLYYFAVAAVNTVGTGAESSQVTSTPTTGGDTITNWTNPYTSAFTTLLSTWFPSGATPFPGSAGVVANLVAMQIASGYDMGLNTLPIVVVPSTQTLVSVGGSNNNFPSSQAPIPSYASTLISGSGDSPLLVYQPGSASYEMWQATDTSGWSCSDGAYVTTSAMTDSTGTVDPGGGYGLAASGLAYLGTAITLADCQRVLNGATDFGHVLALEVSQCDYHALGHFPPADRNDGGLGSGTSGYPMEGMWFYLPAGAASAPSNPFALAAYNTMIRYGCVVTDTTQGGGNYLQVEGSADWAAGGGSGTDPLTTLLAGQATYDVLAPFSGSGSIMASLVQIVPPLTGTPASTPPSAPSGLTLTPSSGQLAASWSGSASMYAVSYRVTSSGTAFKIFYPLITGTSATITGLTNSVTYDVQIWAISVGGCTAGSVVTGTP